MRNGEHIRGDSGYDEKLRRVFEKNNISDLVAPYKAMWYDDMTPIPHEIINEMPNGRIILNNNCAKYLEVLLEVTQLKRVEAPFVLIGETVGDTNKVLFNEFYTIRDNRANQLENNACDVQMVMDDHVELVPNFKNRIREIRGRNDNGRAIICFGHTHPEVSSYYGTYSMADYKNVIQFDDSIEPARHSVGDERSQTLGCMLAANGDVDFMFYDRDAENFYKFTDVERLNPNGEVEGLQCYTFSTPLPIGYRK